MYRSLRLLAPLAAALVCASPAAAQNCPSAAWCQIGTTVTAPNGKISRNFYRTPYAEGVSFNITAGNSYPNHGGSMDTRAAPNDPVLVAMADGQVCSVQDTRSECGCHGNYGGCGNCITIVHANGEMSRYLHLKQGSATAFGMFVGRQVAAGEVVGIEGDVGNTCGADGPPRTGSCMPSVPEGATGCGRHNHWNVIRLSTGEPLMALTCEIPGNLYTDIAQTYTGSGFCSTVLCPNTQTLANTTLPGYGYWQVWQADLTITGSSVTIGSGASAVMHAGQSVRLTPGFHALAGAYFRAEIGLCNTTAPPP